MGVNLTPILQPLLLLVLLLVVGTLAAAAPDAAADSADELQTEAGAMEPPPTIVFTPNFPDRSLRMQLNEVAGVAIDNRSHSFLFHRDGRAWKQNDFDKNNKYTRIIEGPISNPAIVEVDPSGVAVKEFGKKLYYLPHGITVDKDEQLWTTDVARHQVIRLNLRTGEVKEVLGEAFVPGNDSSHLCKPTKVAVASNGDFFVADGYCNHRVMKFNKAGEFLGQFGRKPSGDNAPKADELLIPHGLALLERMDLLCVADREHRRVQCFKAGLKESKEFGKFVKSISAGLGPVYDVDFLPSGDLLILHFIDERRFSLVNIYNFVTDTTVEKFTYLPEHDYYHDKEGGLGMAHTIAASPNGKFIIVGSLSLTCDAERDLLCYMGAAAPYAAFRFSVRQELSSEG